MSGLDRIVAAVKFGETDRQPVIGQVFGHAAAVGNVDLKEYIQNGEVLAKCQIQAWQKYGYDAVFAVMDSSLESEAVGSLLEYRRNLYPFVKRYILSDNANVEDLKVADPYSSGRMPEQLKAIRIMRQEVGNDAAVIGSVLGPMTLTGQLLGLEKALYLAVDQPQVFESILDYSVQVIVEFGRAQIAEGAHVIMVFEPSGSPAVVPPSFFRELLVPKLKHIFGELSAAGSMAKFLHVAGPTRPILQFYEEANVDMVNIDYYVNYDDIKTPLPNVCVCGNIKSGLFVEEDAAVVSQMSNELVETFKKRRGFILSSGCEIPPEANAKNIKAMVEIAHRGC